jgi:hypothetical protein
MQHGLHLVGETLENAKGGRAALLAMGRIAGAAIAPFDRSRRTHVLPPHYESSASREDDRNDAVRPWRADASHSSRDVRSARPVASR